jgi:hypothetical protein
MQKTVLALIAVAGLGFAVAPGALAAPAVGSAIAELGYRTGAVIQIRGGCGRASHRNSEGECRPGCGRGWHYSNHQGHCVSGPRGTPGGPN